MRSSRFTSRTGFSSASWSKSCSSSRFLPGAFSRGFSHFSPSPKKVRRLPLAQVRHWVRTRAHPRPGLRRASSRMMLTCTTCTWEEEVDLLPNIRPIGYELGSEKLAVSSSVGVRLPPPLYSFESRTYCTSRFKIAIVKWATLSLNSIKCSPCVLYGHQHVSVVIASVVFFCCRNKYLAAWHRSMFLHWSTTIPTFTQLVPKMLWSHASLARLPRVHRLRLCGPS